MNIENTVILSALLFLAPIQALAHEGVAHKGKPVHGTIASVAVDHFEMQTDEGPLTVTFSDQTVFEHGGSPATSAHLKTGESVEVHGTKLPGGKLGAEEVLMGTHAGSHSEHQGSDPHAGMQMPH